MKAARLLVAALRAPPSTRGLGEAEWTALLSAAKPERLLGTLAHRLVDEPLRPDVAALLADAKIEAEHARAAALWEAEMARRALDPLGIRTVLLKGAAYAAAGLEGAEGRTIGDLDILVPRDRLADAERALLGAGWEHVKPGEYDQRYYRTWMHELPPLVHRERDRIIDVHHTILPLTHRRVPSPTLMLADAVPLPGNLFALCPEDMVVHAAAHCLVDGDLAGGLRNLWDVHCLSSHMDERRLHVRAAAHQLEDAVDRALRLARHLYADAPASSLDAPFLRRLLARDGWGRARRPASRLAFSVREHWMRMPPLMLARHLIRKAAGRT